MKDLDYLKIAYQHAIGYSTDPSTQNGAIIVNNNLIVARGANHFPQGVKETPERWERPVKYAWVEHAERNAIFDACKLGQATMGRVMYCPWFACADCARAIIQAGIREVVGHDTTLHAGGGQMWKDSIAIAMQMFDEAGVKVRLVKGEIGLTIRFAGNEEKV